MPESTRYHVNDIAPAEKLEGHWDRVPALSRPGEPMGFKSAGQTETEAAPIRYWAELVGTDTNSKRAIRWLITLRRWLSHATRWPLPRRRGGSMSICSKLQSSPRPAGLLSERRNHNHPRFELARLRRRTSLRASNRAPPTESRVEAAR